MSDDWHDPWDDAEQRDLDYEAGRESARAELAARLDQLENALRVAWPIVKRHGDEHEIVTVKDALA